MKVWVIGHPEAVQGFALVGVQGRAAENADSMHQALDEVLTIKDLGIVLLSGPYVRFVRERIEQLERDVGTPIFLEIPGPDGAGSYSKSLTEIVDQAIGIHR